MPDNEEKQRYQEKVALLKAKQGINDHDTEKIISEEKEPRYTKPTGFSAVLNYLYYTKWFFIVGAIILALCIYMVYDAVSREKSDIRVIFISADEENNGYYLKTEAVELAIEKYLPDFNEDNNIHAEVFFINVNKNQAVDLFTAGQTKFLAELNDETGQLYLVDGEALAIMDELTSSQEYLTDLSDEINFDKLSNDNRTVSIFDIDFSKEIDWEAENSLYFAVRNKNTGMKGNNSDTAVENRERALEVLKNISSGNVINK